MMDVLVGVLIAAGSGGLGFYLGGRYAFHKVLNALLSNFPGPK